MADEFSDKLNSILGNPEAMGQILSLAQSLSGGQEKDESTEQSGEAESNQPQGEVPPSAGQTPDPSGLLQLFQGKPDGDNPLAAMDSIDPKLLQLGARLLAELNQTDDRRTALLVALRPFVKPERYAKVDRAIQIARLSRVIRTAFRFFQEEGQGRV